MADDDAKALWEELERRRSHNEGEFKSIYLRIANIDKAFLELEHKIRPLLERETKWIEDKRLMLRHVIMWGIPLLLVWGLTMFTGGVKEWLKIWLIGG